MKIDKKYVTILSGIVIFSIAKLIGGSFLVSLFLAVSIPSLYYLGKTEGKKRFFAVFVGLLISGIDLFLMILLIVPTKSFQINVEDYYEKKENYAKLFFKDDIEDSKKLIFLIKNRGEIRKKIDIPKYIKQKNKEKILLKQGDKIYFICKIKKECLTYKSFVAIYLWDDSIFRITPGTVINLNKITKDLQDLTNSKTNIGIEKGNLWFHVIRLIKDSNNMQIETGKGQILIIRGTAGFVNKQKENTYAIDYSHYIEVKNKTKSVILKQGEAAQISEDNIEILDMNEILNKIGINKDFLDNLNKLDKKYINNSLKELNNYIKQIQNSNLIGKLEELKVKTFAVGNSKYKQYLENLENIKYLVGEKINFSSSLSNNPNLAFLSSNLEKTEVKLGYLYNKLHENLENNDIYKTYIINMGIAGKIDNVNEAIKEGIDNINKKLENIMENTDKSIDNLINKFNK